jgi:hypothetical protein
MKNDKFIFLRKLKVISPISRKEYNLLMMQEPSSFKERGHMPDDC